jgi:hypothetical protein
MNIHVFCTFHDRRADSYPRVMNHLEGPGNGLVKAKLGAIRGLFRVWGGNLHQDRVF